MSSLQARPSPGQSSSPRTMRGTARMFESDFLEYFSRVHPAIPSALYLPLSLGSLYFAIGVEGQPLWAVGLGVLGGYVLWTFFEYWLHRLLFHLPVIGPKTQRIYFLIHGVHHDYPWDETRLVIPTGASVVLGVLMYGLFRLVLGSHMYAPFAGFVMGYVAYDTVHWYVHARAPRNRFFRWLRREHLVHHFKEPNSRYGVSCPWLDYVFGTRGTHGSRASEAAAEAADKHEAPQGAQPAR